MTFTIHFIFTFLAGIIFRPLFIKFYPWFLFSFLKKITFFRVKHMVLHSMFFEFLNALPHSMHVSAMMFCKIPSQEQLFLVSTATLSSLLFFILFGILDMLQHMLLLDFLSRHYTFLASTSCSSLFSIVYHILQNIIFYMFHHFSQSSMTFSAISLSKIFLHFFQTFLTFLTCYVCKIPSREKIEIVSRILYVHIIFDKFLWVCAKQFCIKLQLNSSINF